MQAAQAINLKSEVERTFGRRILSSADCNELSDHIFHMTGSRLSFNTLRRFFQLMKSEFRSSSNTLNVLAKYCGYSSIDNFIRSKEDEPSGLDAQCDAKLLKFMVLQFSDVEVRQNFDPTYLSLVRIIINFLNFCPGIIDQLQREIAKTKNGQMFYYEYFVNVDKLHKFYGDGLKYYLLEKKSREAQLFGHTLLCFRYWLANDSNGVMQHYNEVMKYKIDETVHPFICARYFAAQLYMASDLNRKKDHILTQARSFFHQIETSKSASSMISCFLLYLIEALVITNETCEALYYIGKMTRRNHKCTGVMVDEKLFSAVPLYYALANARLGDIARAREIFKSIRPGEFYFLSKQFYTILYIQLKTLLYKTDEDRTQLEFLIKETGFIRLLIKNSILLYQ